MGSAVEMITSWCCLNQLLCPQLLWSATFTCNSTCRTGNTHLFEHSLAQSAVKVTHPGAESQVSTATEPQFASFCIPLYRQRKSGKRRNRGRRWRWRKIKHVKWGKMGMWREREAVENKWRELNTSSSRAGKGGERVRKRETERVGEKCSEMTAPLKTEKLFVGVGQV